MTLREYVNQDQKVSRRRKKNMKRDKWKEGKKEMESEM